MNRSYFSALLATLVVFSSLAQTPLDEVVVSSPVLAVSDMPSPSPVPVYINNVKGFGSRFFSWTKTLGNYTATVTDANGTGGIYETFDDTERSPFEVHASWYYTRKNNGGCLDGIMRKQIIRIAKKLDISCVEEAISPFDLQGGNALKFYASVRLDIRRSTQIKDRNKHAINLILQERFNNIFLFSLKGTLLHSCFNFFVTVRCSFATVHQVDLIQYQPARRRMP